METEVDRYADVVLRRGVVSFLGSVLLEGNPRSDVKRADETYFDSRSGTEAWLRLVPIYLDTLSILGDVRGVVPCDFDTRMNPLGLCGKRACKQQRLR